MGREAEERCRSRRPEGVRVRCYRWADHAGEHRGFDWQDMAYRWSEEQVEDRRLGEEPRVEGGPAWKSVFDQPKTAIEQWKDRCLKAERVRDAHYESYRIAVQQRDTEAKNAMKLVKLNGELEQSVKDLTRANLALVKQRDDARRELRAVRDQMSAEDGERIQRGQQLQEARDRIRELEEAVREMAPASDTEMAVSMWMSQKQQLERQVANQAEVIREQRRLLREWSSRDSAEA